jgi:serine/threonine protein kinase
MATQTRTPPSAVDIWALGVLVFEACFDMHPFLARSFSDINNLKSQISILCQNGYSFAAYK